MVLTGSWDKTARLRKMSLPIEGTAEQNILRLSVLSKMELDESGAVHVLDAETWQWRRQQLAELGGPLVP